MSKTKLTGRIVTPDSPLYSKARIQFNKPLSEFPKVIVFCKKDQDVINAVKWSRERAIPLRARSGRHNYEAFSSVDKGIVIDVSDLNKVVVDLKKGIAIVGAGIRLGELYKKLWEKGVTIPGGSCPTVGAGGLTLGGGIGYLSRLLGLTCDSLLGLNIVVANGKQSAKLIHASNKCNSDLFWASRGGGGGNFGIATTFVFKVTPISNVSVYKIVWNWDDTEKVLEAWQRWAPFVDKRLSPNLQLQAKQTNEFYSVGQFVGSANELKKLIQPLIKVAKPKEVTVKTIPFIEAVAFFGSLVAQRPHPFKNTGSFVTTPLPAQAIRIIKNYLSKAPNAKTVIEAIAFGGAIRNVSSHKTAFVHRKADYVLQIEASWTNRSEHDRNIRWAESLRTALLPYTNGAFVNFPDRLIKDWPKAYYGSNYNRLQVVKQKYDPYNIFKFEQSIRLPG